MTATLIYILEHKNHIFQKEIDVEFFNGGFYILTLGKRIQVYDGFQGAICALKQKKAGSKEEHI